MRGEEFGVLVLQFGEVSIMALIFVGLTGNVLTILTYFNTKMGNMQPFLYLVMLSVTDSLVLIMYLLKTYGPEATLSPDFFLQEVVTISGIWLVVAFTHNRYISLKYPLFTKSTWTLRNTKLVIAIIFATFTSYESVLYVLLCAPSISHKVMLVSSFLSCAVRILIPLPLILFFNVSTLVMMTKYNKNDVRRLRNTSEQYNLTKLLLISSVMILFIIPHEVMRGIYFLMEVEIIGYNHALYTNEYLNEISQTCSLFSYCGDFFIYCLSGTLFRSALRELCCRCRRTM